MITLDGYVASHRAVANAKSLGRFRAGYGFAPLNT